MEKLLRLSGEPLEVRMSDDCIAVGLKEEDYLIEYKIDGKIVAYILLKPWAIKNDEVLIISGFKIIKSFSHKKYKDELAVEMNKYFDGKLISVFDESNFKIGEFYCGSSYVESKPEPRKIKILELIPSEFALIDEKIIYKHENVLYKKVSCYDWGRLDKPIELIKKMLKNKTASFSKSDNEEYFIVNDDCYYIGVGKLLG